MSHTQKYHSQVQNFTQYDSYMQFRYSAEYDEEKASSTSLLQRIQRRIARVCRPKKLMLQRNSSIDSLAYAQSDDSYAESLESENIAWGKAPKRSKRQRCKTEKYSRDKPPASPDASRAICRLWL